MVPGAGGGAERWRGPRRRYCVDGAFYCYAEVGFFSGRKEENQRDDGEPLREAGRNPCDDGGYGRTGGPQVCARSFLWLDHSPVHVTGGVSPTRHLAIRRSVPLLFSKYLCVLWIKAFFRSIL